MPETPLTTDSVAVGDTPDDTTKTSPNGSSGTSDLLAYFIADRLDRTTSDRAWTGTHMKRITADEWRVIEEALNHRLAGEIEDVDQPPEVYKRALAKVQERIR